VSSSDVQRRKAEHVRVVTEHDVESRTSAGWEDVHLLHEALPRTDLDRVDLSVEFLGRRLRAPLVIASMTGGHAAAHEVNARLAAAAQRHGLAMGLGSQRAALHSPNLAATYRVARETAPDAFLIANIGAAQLVPQGRTPAVSSAELCELVAMVSADALAIHLNFLEEMIQPEGDRYAAGLRTTLPRVVGGLTVPAIAKETGCGISRSTAQELAEVGFDALDVGGLGGTSFAAVEALRAEEQGDRRGAALGRLYREWGIPTAVAVVGAAPVGLPVIATGGVRTGVDAAKALAIGARAVGVARPLLSAALAGADALEAWISQFLEELRVAVLLTGGGGVADLRLVPRVFTGNVRDWLGGLGYA
jgi:isopentenyl-diphosphate Delta-isomerase